MRTHTLSRHAMSNEPMLDFTVTIGTQYTYRGYADNDKPQLVIPYLCHRSSKYHMDVWLAPPWAVKQYREGGFRAPGWSVIKRLTSPPTSGKL